MRYVVEQAYNTLGKPSGFAVLDTRQKPRPHTVAVCPLSSMALTIATLLNASVAAVEEDSHD